MTNHKQEVFQLVTKLMNEEISNDSPQVSKYQKFMSRVMNDLPQQLDKGEYIDNAAVIRNIVDRLEEYEILAKIPDLVGKTLISIAGSTSILQKTMESFVKDVDLLSYNDSIPYLILPSADNHSTAIYALTYCNQLVALTLEEYQLVGKLNDHHINPSQLVKAFIAYHPLKYRHEAYMIMPLLADENNVFFKRLKTFIVKECTVSTFKKMVGKHTHYIANAILALKLEEVLLDVHLFYKKEINERVFRLSKFNENIIQADEGDLQDNLKKYRNRLKEQKASLERAYREFCGIADQVIGDCQALEKEIFPLHGVNEIKTSEIDNNMAIQVLVKLCFHHILNGMYQEASDDQFRLSKLGYYYKEALAYLLHVSQTGQPLSQSEEMHMRGISNKEYYIPKIKLAMAKKLQLEGHELDDVIDNLSPIETGDEYFYRAIRTIQKGNLDTGIEGLWKSLDLGCKKAMGQLVELRKMYGEKISEKRLASYLEPTTCASLAVDKKESATDRQIYSRIAAAQGDLEAIKQLADRLYGKYIDRMPSTQDEVNQVYEIISLYKYLLSYPIQSHRQKNMIKMGLLYDKIGDDEEAYPILKKYAYCDAKAAYACGRIAEECYGDRDSAIKFYGQANSYKDAAAHYERLKNQREAEKAAQAKAEAERERKRKEAYDAQKSYSQSRSTSSSSSSSGCFVITATCKALQKDASWTDLSRLIKFRNAFVRMEGSASVAEYYRLGPMIVDHINAEADSQAMYKSLWSQYIEPSLTAFLQGNLDAVRHTYIKMCKMLCDKYHIPVKEDIYNKYQ